MFTYFHITKKYFLSTNPKVLTSTLNKQDKLVRLEGFHKYSNNAKLRLKLPHRQHYLLVRNPYDRVESFFKEKLRKCVLQTKGDPPYQLKLHQEIFYNHLNIDPQKTTLDEKINIFVNFSFEDYVNTLPQVYLLDQHLRPQSLSYRPTVKRVIPYRFKFDRILQIEQTKDMLFLSQFLGINTSIRANASNDLGNEVKWTPQLRSMVNSLYERDFVELGYKTIGE